MHQCRVGFQRFEIDSYFQVFSSGANPRVESTSWQRIESSRSKLIARDDNYFVEVPSRKVICKK